MHRFVLLGGIVVFSSSVLMLAGCLGGKTEPTRFYALSPLSRTETAKPPGTAEHDGTIGIGPVQLPEYLNRPEIVTRTSQNQLHLADFHQWAEPLRESFSRVLAENLSMLLSTDRVAVFPWGLTPIDYQVTVEVARFERQPGGENLLVARWSILRDNGKEILLTRNSSFSEPAAAGDYEATVSAQSRVLAEFSREIAAAITAISQKTADR